LLDPNEHMRSIIKDLKKAEIVVSGMYIATAETDAGLEIDGKYVLQFAPYYTPKYLLDKVESPGEDFLSFSDINTLIEYLLESSNDESF
jgi:hypothetical protein